MSLTDLTHAAVPQGKRKQTGKRAIQFKWAFTIGWWNSSVYTEAQLLELNNQQQSNLFFSTHAFQCRNISTWHYFFL